MGQSIRSVLSCIWCCLPFHATQRPPADIWDPAIAGHLQSPKSACPSYIWKSQKIQHTRVFCVFFFFQFYISYSSCILVPRQLLCVRVGNARQHTDHQSPDLCDPCLADHHTQHACCHQHQQSHHHHHEHPHKGSFICGHSCQAMMLAWCKVMLVRWCKVMAHYTHGYHSAWVVSYTR